MPDMERLEIDYSQFEKQDVAFFERIFDPTSYDSKLTGDDLTSLNREQLDDIYNLVRGKYNLDSNGGESTSVDSERIKQYVQMHMKSPEQYVKDAAHKNQFLVFGEAHDSPKTRRFMASMIPILKEEGFSHFAIELDRTYQSDMERYMETGDRAIFAKVVWMNDEFFEILDACKASGLKVVCIDEPSTHGMNREESDPKMLENLQSQILDFTPNAKVAIFIGNFHIDESEELDSIHNGRITKTPTKAGALGYLLEKARPGKSHSISIVDSESASSERLGKFLTQNIGGPFAISTDLPFLHTIITGPAFLFHTVGGSYDALIGL